MATNIYATLDGLLAKYFDNRENSTTPNERATSKSLFDKLCKKHDINATNYMNNSHLNPNNQRNSRSQQKSRPAQNTQKTSYGNTSYNNTWDDDWDVEDFFNNIFRQAYAKKKQEEYQQSRRYTHNDSYDSARYTNYQRETEEQQKRARQAKEKKEEAERKKQQEEKNKNRWEEKSYTYMFSMKDPLLTEIGRDGRGQRYIKFSGLAKRPHEQRAPVQNFVIYSEEFDPKKWFERKDVTFRVETGKAFYYHNHLVVHSLWMIQGDLEYEIKLDRIGG